METITRSGHTKHNMIIILWKSLDIYIQYTRRKKMHYMYNIINYGIVISGKHCVLSESEVSAYVPFACF